MPSPTGELVIPTIAVERELWNGDRTLSPVADPTRVAYGTADGVRVDLAAFLREHLANVPPEELATYTFPDGARLIAVDVPITREDLPRRLQLKTPFEFHCLVIPAAAVDVSGESWVIVLALGHTFYVGPRDDLEKSIRSEVERLVASAELSPSKLLELLPPYATRLTKLDLEVERLDRIEPGRAASLRRKLIEHQKKKLAFETLASIAAPLPRGAHAGLVARDDQIAQLAALLTGEERLSVLLVGRELVGKTAVVRAWLARERRAGKERLVFATSGAQLIAGMSGLGQWQERVKRVMEAAELLDAIIYFENLGDLFTERPEGHVDIAGAIKPWIEEGRVRLLGELAEDLVDHVESRHVGFMSCLSRLRLVELTAAETRTALANRIAVDAANDPDRRRPHLKPEAAQTVVDLAERYLPYRAFPGKAIRFYEELRAVCERDRDELGRGLDLGVEKVFEVFSLQTGVPAFLLREDRALRVEEVAQFFEKRLIGQKQAIRRVAETACVIKANLQPTHKPLATFLFVGPTGVGKTELARCLAQFLFGAADRAIRFDMSEYMDAQAAERLIRGTDRAEGVLTRRVREQPFCVLLLDEIEKAHPAVFDLLLQVCGEGRLTDARGKTAWFHNAIIIMTSNIGAAHRRPSAGFVQATSSDEEAHYLKAVNAHFRPEFVNRLDRIITFAALTPDEVRAVARLVLNRIAERRGVVDAGVTLEVSEDALGALAAGGYSEAYGARQLRRHLEDALVAPLARAISTQGPLARGARIDVRATSEPPPELPDLLETRERAGVVVRLHRGWDREKTRDVKSISDLAALRRRAEQLMELDGVVDVKERIDFLIAQMSYGSRPNAPAPSSGQLAQLVAEHQRLSDAWQELARRLAELTSLEEVALSLVVEGESATGILGEAGAVYRRFRHALVYVLLAPRRRNQITLLWQEAARHIFETVVPELIAEAKVRGWELRFHVIGGPDDPVFWHDADWIADAVERPRTWRNLVVTVSGPWAGSLLGPEGGLHRFVGFASGEPIYLMVTRVKMSAQLAPDEWKMTPLDPPPPPLAGELDALPAVRHRDQQTSDLTIVKQRVLRLDGPYYACLEEIVLEHLLLLEETYQDPAYLWVGAFDGKA